jgi:short-subunit dehydrogenase
MIKKGGGGRIINNITSEHEGWPMPGNAAYCLSKGGIRMLTRTAGIELAPHNILVVAVAPGAVATPINLSSTQDPSLMKRLNDAIPLGRITRPEEIASRVAFVAEDGASYMAATTVFADDASCIAVLDFRFRPRAGSRKRGHRPMAPRKRSADLVAKEDRLPVILALRNLMRSSWK